MVYASMPPMARNRADVELERSLCQKRLGSIEVSAFIPSFAVDRWHELIQLAGRIDFFATFHAALGARMIRAIVAVDPGGKAHGVHSGIAARDRSQEVVLLELELTCRTFSLVLSDFFYALLSRSAQRENDSIFREFLLGVCE